MKPRVLALLEDGTGDRCVDILAVAEGNFGYSECRRDPEDSHGWRRLSGIRDGFATQAGARAAAGETVGWLEDAE